MRRLGRLAVVVFAVVGVCAVGGCSVTVNGDASPAGHDSATQRQVTDLIGTWKGTYRCSQGETGLTLEITATSEPGSDLPWARAVFAFEPIRTNPGVESGSYSMVVTHEFGATFRFTQREWISRPIGYRMVDLVGGLLGSGLSGSVIGDGCTTFAVVRS